MRRWKEKNRSLNTPLGRRFTKEIAKKLKKKGFTYKIKTEKQWLVIYQGRKMKMSKPKTSSKRKTKTFYLQDWRKK